MAEVKWKSLEFLGFDNYEVSSEGNVRNVVTGTQLKTGCNTKGYQQLRLPTAEGKKKSVRIHRLVAMAFIPNPDNLPEVNHKDYDRTNNDVSNLEWCSGRYNLEYSKKNNHVLKYDEQGKLLSKYWSIVEAAKDNGITYDALRSYLRGHYKSHTCNGFIYRYEGVDPMTPITDNKYIEQRREYYSRPEVKEHYSKQRKQYYIANRDQILERAKEYYDENKEAICERVNEYRLANKEVIRERKHQYYQRKKAEQEKKYVTEFPAATLQ